MEIIEKLNQYYLFSYISETPIYYCIHTKINDHVKYGGKVFNYNICFKINKKNFNIKKSNPKLYFNKKLGDYEYIDNYNDMFTFHFCRSISCSIKHIETFFEDCENKIEEYI